MTIEETVASIAVGTNITVTFYGSTSGHSASGTFQGADMEARTLTLHTMHDMHSGRSMTQRSAGRKYLDNNDPSATLDANEHVYSFDNIKCVEVRQALTPSLDFPQVRPSDILQGLALDETVNQVRRASQGDGE